MNCRLSERLSLLSASRSLLAASGIAGPTWLEFFLFLLLLSHPSLRDGIALTAAPSPWSLDGSPASVIDTLGRDRSHAVRRGKQHS